MLLLATQLDTLFASTTLVNDTEVATTLSECMKAETKHDKEFENTEDFSVKAERTG